MKKVISLLLVLMLSIGLLAGCTPAAPVAGPAPAPAEPAAPAETPAEEGTITKLGLGHIISIAKSKDKGTDAEGKAVNAGAQADVVIASVGFDADGKVVSAFIDVAQTKVAFDEALVVTTDKTAEVKTKKDIGADYGMVKASGIGKEWFEQIAALEDWMVGKTVEEIKGMKMADGKTAEEDLVSSVTISVGDYITAVEQAWNEGIEVAGGETVGLGVKTSIAKSKDAGKDAEGKEVKAQAQVDTIMSAAAFDAEGKVAGAVIDTAQVRIPFDSEGKITIDKTAALKTKNELKEDYGMIKASAIGKEWYEQARALADWMVGKSIDEITSMELADGNTTVAELVSSVTIGVEDYLYVVDEASSVAK